MGTGRSKILGCEMRRTKANSDGQGKPTRVRHIAELMADAMGLDTGGF